MIEEKSTWREKHSFVKENYSLLLLLMTRMSVCMWPWIPSGNVAPMFYPLLFICNRNYDYGQNFPFYHKTKCKAADKTLEQSFLKEFKATGKKSGESEPKQQKGIWKVIWVGHALGPLIEQKKNQKQKESGQFSTHTVIMLLGASCSGKWELNYSHDKPTDSLMSGVHLVLIKDPSGLWSEFEGLFPTVKKPVTVNYCNG